MSFNDNPIIDSSSKASEESINATKRIFSQRNDFICREEHPDKGVDLNVEIIQDGEASGLMFAVQVKSVQDIRMVNINNCEFLSFPFKTSRLGYLCSRLPGLGLIIIYDDRNKTLYYDHVEEIYKRIMLDKNDESWKEQETINIHIPEENKLNVENAKIIYDIMQRRFINYKKLLAKHAKEFDIPYVSTITNDFKDFDILDPKELLEKYGFLLFNEQDFHIIYDLISNLSIAEVAKSPRLLLLSALTYSEIGKILDSNYFIEKCFSYTNEYDKEEKNLLFFTKYSVDFLLGKIEGKEYCRLLKDLSTEIENKVNLFNVKIRIIYLEILISKSQRNLEIMAKIKQLISEINSSDIEEATKHILYMNLVSLLYEIIISIFIKEVIHFKIRGKIFGADPLTERVEKAKFLTELMEMPLSLITESHKFAIDKKDELLIALCLYRESYFFFSFQFYITMLSVMEDKIKEENTRINEYKFNIDKAIQAHYIFIKKNLYRKAYEALFLSLELYKLYSQKYNNEIDKYYDKEKILRDKATLEKELNINPFESLVDEFFKEGLPALTKEIICFSDLPEEEIPDYADTLIRSLNIPNDRKENIILDIKNHQKFEKLVNIKYFNLLQNLEHTRQKETIYKDPLKYVIECKKCSYMTKESENIEELINQLKREHDYYCF